MTTGRKILVVDDEIEIGEFIAAAAENLGLECIFTTDAIAMEQLLTPDVGLIVLDLMMPEMDGIEAMRRLSELKCKAGIVLMSGISTRVLETAEKLARSLDLVVVGHLSKPFKISDLEAILLKQHPIGPKVVTKTSPPFQMEDERLQAAVDRNEFLVHYQPQIDIATGAVIGVEALVRWQCPERGLLYPDSFLRRAEQMGLIDDLGWLVAERALEEVKQFASSDGVVPRLALNLSVQSLHDLNFPDRFIDTLHRHGTPMGSVILEITESGLIYELSNMLDVLTRLCMKGIKLSIDDFGTGYAMMQQLLNIPATELKIDREFVMNMDLSTSDRVMVEKSIEIGHELGMKVLAEGVETAEQLGSLRQKGCDAAQGYFFSRALPPKDLVHWLATYEIGNSR
jgi:EAL domain-containing protein (putative c-di-GMP-specific phosphodiesterase class I)